jgi:transposase
MPSRAEILALDDQGVGTQEIARGLQISLAWARRVKQEWREQGKTRNATTRNRQPMWATLVPKIRAALAAQPDLTLEELKAELGTTLHSGTLCRELKKLKLTFNKSREGGGAGSAGRGPATGRMGRESGGPGPGKTAVSR